MNIALKSGVKAMDKEQMKLCGNTSHMCSLQWREYEIVELRRSVFIALAVSKMKCFICKHYIFDGQK